MPPLSLQNATKASVASSTPIVGTGTRSFFRSEMTPIRISVSVTPGVSVGAAPSAFSAEQGLSRVPTFEPSSAAGVLPPPPLASPPPPPPAAGAPPVATGAVALVSTRDPQAATKRRQIRTATVRFMGPLGGPAGRV